MGVATEQAVGDDFAVTVAPTVVTTVVGEGVAVRMQEQALLSLDIGNCVVADRSRLPLAAGVAVVLRESSGRANMWLLDQGMLT